MPVVLRAPVLPWCAAALTIFAVAQAHELGYSSLSLQLLGRALEGELVLDVPAAALALPGPERRSRLLKRVGDGLVLESAGTQLDPTLTVLSLGHGSRAVDVVRLRATLPAVRGALRITAAADLGPVAVALAIAGRRAERLIVEGGRSGVIALEPAGPESLPPDAAVTPPGASAPEPQSPAPPRVRRFDGFTLRLATLLVGAVLALGLAATPPLSRLHPGLRLALVVLAVSLWTALVWWLG
jgi:hypothetical protein